MISAWSNVSFFHRDIRHKSYAYNMFSIGSTLPVSFSALRACFTATLILSRPEGFNMFLPVRYRIEIGSDAWPSEVITVVAPSGTMLQLIEDPSIPRRASAKCKDE